MKFRLKAASGPRTGQTFELGDATLVGAGDDVDVRLDGIDDEHARIVRRDDGLVLEASGETRVNGETVDVVALQSGDELQVGTHRFVLQAPGLKPARVLDQVAGQRRGGTWKWLAAAAAAAAAAAGSAWWLLLGPGAGA
jgi:predicted component of type VI protein secretion system